MKVSDSEFINAVNSALSSDTIYAFGQVGSPISDNIMMKGTPFYGMTAAKKNQSTRAYAASYKNARPTAKKVKNGVFGFDCSGLIQGCLCGWKADNLDWIGGIDNSALDHRYSANEFASISSWNGKILSADEWSSIRPGDVMFQSSDGGKTVNHIAVFVGDGKAVECAYNWCGANYGMTDGVQEITLVGFSDGYMRTNRDGCSGTRRWIGFGSLPMVEYSSNNEKSDEESQDVSPEIIILNNEDCCPDEVFVSKDVLDSILESAKDSREQLNKLIEKINEIIKDMG